MESKIRVGAVSYINAKPLIYGFEHGLLKDEVDLILQPPADLASGMKAGRLDIALLPVAVIPELPGAVVISRYCIGSNGPVASVALFSEVPLDEIEQVYLDSESRTSVALLKLLMEEHWKISPETIPAFPGYEKKISGKTAGLIIGNRALEQTGVNAFKYDLSEAWKELTGLPFVFAAWVAVKNLPAGFIDDFDDAVSRGLEKLDELSASVSFPFYDLLKYFHEDIDYRLDESKKKAMELFLQKIPSYSGVL